MGVDAAAKHVTVVAPKRVVARQPMVAGELQRQLHRADGVGGDGVFEASAVGERQRCAGVGCLGRVVVQHAVGAQRGGNFAGGLLSYLKAGPLKQRLVVTSTFDAGFPLTA